MKNTELNGYLNMQVTSFNNGVAQVDMALDDLNDTISIVTNAERLEPEFLDSVEDYGLPLIEGDVIDRILGALNLAKTDVSTNKAVLPCDRNLAIYLTTILKAAALRGEYEDFPREDGSLIDTDEKAHLARQLDLIKIGFNPEEMIQKLEQIRGYSIPRFQHLTDC